MIPSKLKKGDEIRVISPSRSLAIISKENRKIAVERLETLGFKVTFSKNASEKNEFNSSSVKSRIADIRQAFKDKNVKAILTTLGGFNSNQLLRYLDYNLIKSNPKIFCGYSDITALSNAIFNKTGLVTYSGPHFSSFGMLKGFDYTLEYFKKCLMEAKPINIKASLKWSDDAWYLNQNKRKFIKNKGPFVINNGEVEGIILGGNLCTLNLLQGAEFMPSLKNKILFIEDDEESLSHTFDRDLQSLIHLPDFPWVKGIIIGRFQKASKMSKELLVKIVKTKKELERIPVIADVDFGHTTPRITFPIGGTAAIVSRTNNISIKIVNH